MNSLRKWLYRPRRDDKSLLAKFWYADDNLNRVAAELDSFDGRKDPERCAALVSRLRSCQDKLLNICTKMLDELEGPGGRASREFRQKFPDEIVTDNLGGQLWFGAECLAAGSSIMNKEFESEQMRPLAKAVTKTLERVRSYLREQCLSPTPNYTEDIHENLKIFDRLFSEFEFSYVSCMVHVKTVKEYEIQQDVICLFSDTLQRAINNQMITQEMVDLYDPSLMFAIPRLAIVCGLIVFPNGPLNVDRETSDFPELFRPFKNLLRKIRDLLVTLTPSEFFVLERLLCQLEEPTDLERKLQAAQKEMEDSKQIAGRADQAARLDAKLAEEKGEAHIRTEEREGKRIVEEMLEEILSGVIGKEHSDKEVVRKVDIAVVEIDCTSPDISVREDVKKKTSEEDEKVEEECTECCGENSVGGVEELRRKNRGIRGAAMEETGSRGKRSSLRRRNGKRTVRNGKDARARFKSSEDLIHRLYVCISGAADQLQTNFAGDFRSILKYVFLMNSTQEEEEEEEVTGEDEDLEDEEGRSQESLSLSEGGDDDTVDSVGVHLTPSTIDETRPQQTYSLGEDALMSETEQSYLRNFTEGSDLLREGGGMVGPGLDPSLLSTSPPAGLASMPVYASNLGYHLGSEQGGLGRSDDGEVYYQPEPTLLTIASGEGGVVEEQERGRSRTVEAPPAWVPDSMAPLCMGCGAAFSLVKRRHHCRSCGRVFCAKCSPNQVPLPRYGMQKAVRVCNRCYIYYMNPYEERTAHAYHVYSGTGHGSWGYSGMVS